MRTQPTTIRIPEDVRRELERIAAADSRTVSAVVVLLIRRALTNEPARRPAR